MTVKSKLFWHRWLAENLFCCMANFLENISQVLLFVHFTFILCPFYVHFRPFSSLFLKKKLIDFPSILRPFHVHFTSILCPFNVHFRVFFSKINWPWNKTKYQLTTVFESSMKWMISMQSKSFKNCNNYGECSSIWNAKMVDLEHFLLKLARGSTIFSARLVVLSPFLL